MADDQPALDDHQYTVAGLREYEAIYGRDFVSPGGRAMTAEILNSIGWADSRRVLDVGCGLGGAAFMFATDHGADVTAVDASRNMAVEAAKRATDYELDGQVSVVHGDIMTADVGGQFDVIHSREVFLHIHAKADLFATLSSLLRDGGQLIFTDYCRGDQPSTRGFDSYLSEFGYDLRTVAEIGSLMGAVGLSDISAIDMTERFIAIHHDEIAGLPTSGLSEEKQRHMAEGWQAKIDRAEAGEQRWGWFRATGSG